MNLFLGVIGVLILCGALVIWFLYFRRIQEDAGLVELPKKKNPGANDLEQFIAAYRSGQVTAADLKAEQASPAPQPALQPASQPAPQPAATAAPAAAQTAFLRPEVKVAYLSLRACLRDHHVFAHVRLADLGRASTCWCAIPASNRLPRSTSCATNRRPTPESSPFCVKRACVTCGSPRRACRNPTSCAAWCWKKNHEKGRSTRPFQEPMAAGC
jgi:hypothetical protein